MAGTSGEESSSSSVPQKKTSFLLGLPDELLVQILERVNNVATVVKFGEVSKRLRAIPHLVTRIQTSLSDFDDEIIFRRFLTRKKGPLRELYVASGPRNLSREDIQWIERVCDKLWRLELDLSWRKRDPFARLVARCSALEELKLYSKGPRDVDPEAVETVVSSCPRLKLLILYYLREYDLNLTSSSLQTIDLEKNVTANLETPALTNLRISGAQLDVSSHSLRRLRLNIPTDEHQPPEEPLGFHISPPLSSNLEYLCFAENISAEQTLEFLQRSGGDLCVDVLHLAPFNAPPGASSPMKLAALLEPLARLRVLRVDFPFVEALTSDLAMDGEEESGCLVRLGVEEVQLYMMVGFGDSLFEFMPHIRRFLISLPPEKVVVDWAHGNRDEFWDLAMSLRHEFPRVTLRGRMLE